MSTEFNLCPKCGGIKDPIPVAYPRAFGLCRCMPVTKHDGVLEQFIRRDEGWESVFEQVEVEITNRKVVYLCKEGQDDLVICPAQALSLLAWLQQERPELERLAKGQAGE